MEKDLRKLKKAVIAVPMLGLLSMLLLTGCSKNEHEATSVNNSIEKQAQKSTSSSSSESEKESRSEVAKQTSGSSAYQSTQEDQASTNESESATLETSSENESTEQVNPTPYAVDLADWGSVMDFHLSGVNVPEVITLDAANNTLTLTSKNGSNDVAYSVSSTTIPTQAVRVFSHVGNAVRTVKVNTQIVINNQLSGSPRLGNSGPMYLFVNNNGGLSLITPNFAGNVEPDQSDVMLEAVL